MALIDLNNQNQQFQEENDALAQKAALAKLLKSATQIDCDSCHGKNFIEVFHIKKISGLATGTGRDVMVPIPVFACADCGNVNKVFAPVEEKKEE